MIKNILCPVDHSPSSLQALGYAIAIARWHGARLNLLEVIETPAPRALSRTPKHYGLPKETRRAVADDLSRVLVSRGTSDLKVGIFVRAGNVVQEILAQVKASRSDLVVIGSHGRGGVQRLVLGSVAERILRLANCPVLTVRRGVNRARRRGSPFETILCATDFSAAANKAVAYAKRLAEEADARLILMSAVEWPLGETAMSAAVAQLRQSIESRAREALARLLPRPGTAKRPAEPIVSIGKPSACVSRSHARDRWTLIGGFWGVAHWTALLVR